LHARRARYSLIGIQDLPPFIGSAPPPQGLANPPRPQLLRQIVLVCRQDWVLHTVLRTAQPASQPSKGVFSSNPPRQGRARFPIVNPAQGCLPAPDAFVEPEQVILFHALSRNDMFNLKTGDIPAFVSQFSCQH